MSWVALRSYSIYLTHALAIHVARRVAGTMILEGVGNLLLMCLFAATAGRILSKRGAPIDTIEGPLGTAIAIQFRTWPGPIKGQVLRCSLSVRLCLFPSD